jgi:hypothetical protein
MSGWQAAPFPWQRDAFSCPEPSPFTQAWNHKRQQAQGVCAKQWMRQTRNGSYSLNIRPCQGLGASVCSANRHQRSLPQRRT